MANSTMVQVVINGEVLVLPETYVNTLDALDKWLYIEDWQSINILLGSAAALYVPGDPLWLRYIGGSGGGKTEVLRAISAHADSFELATFTSASLTGGFKDGYKLLKNIDGKRVVTLDISPLITKNSDSRKQIFGILRYAFDGSFVSAFGSPEQLLKQKASFDWLLGATPAIESQRSLDAELGERFIDLRLQLKDREKASERASKNAGVLKQMRQEIGETFGQLLEYCKTSPIPQLHPDIADKIPKLANLMTLLRSPVSRDRYNNVSYIPVPEFGTRVAQALSKLAKGLALIKGKNEADWEEYMALVRVASDSLPSTRKVIMAEYLSGKRKIEEISKATKFSIGQVSELLRDLELLGIKKDDNLLVDFTKAIVTAPGTNWPVQIDYAEVIGRR